MLSWKLEAVAAAWSNSIEMEMPVDSTGTPPPATCDSGYNVRVGMKGGKKGKPINILQSI